MRALVTGANGLIGGNLVRELLAHGVAVRGLVRATSDTIALDGLEVELCRADVATDPDALCAAASGCELIFHTAMHFSYETRRHADLEAAASRGTENLLRAAHAAKVARVIVTSSSVVFGHSATQEVLDEQAPLAMQGENAYVHAKLRQHRLALAFGAALGLDVIAVCPTVSVGPYGTALGPSNGHIIAYLADPFRLSYPGGCNIVATADVAAGHWLAAQHGTPGSAYILGSENLTWAEFH
ncbi:MAG: NAD-dependent epimerase/dehydratase family protein, partial [Thiotrichales bacterium]